MAIVKIPTYYYQHFGADYSLEVPGEGFGGWKKAELPLNLEKTAIVVMHAWDCGTYEQYPGWHRAVEYIPRAVEICKTQFPRILKPAREKKLKIYHVVGGTEYYENLPGYLKAVSLSSSKKEEYEKVDPDEVYNKLIDFKTMEGHPGKDNIDDINRGISNMNFMTEAMPYNDEGVAENAEQLFALCKNDGVNHLIYIGFAINWCLLLSPGGMADMQKRGLLCSTIRQAVTAVENKETAREQLCKEIGLWRVALAFGYVYDSDDFIQCISN